MLMTEKATSHVPPQQSVAGLTSFVSQNLDETNHSLTVTNMSLVAIYRLSL